MANIETQVKQIVADKLGVDYDEIHNSSSFIYNLGADSLDAVELIMEFEKAFGINIPDDQAETITTVGDAIAYIQNACGEYSPSYSSQTTISEPKSLADEKRDYFWENVNEITSNIDSTKLFLRDCESVIRQGVNNEDLFSLRVIQSLCCLEYSANHLDDTSLVRKGEECADIAFSEENDEEAILFYNLVKLAYRRIHIYSQNYNAYNQHVEISNEFSRIQGRITSKKSKDDSGIFEWLEFTYKKASYDSIQALYYNYVNNNDFVNAANCLHLIDDLDIDFFTVWTCDEFYTLYTIENGLQPVDKAYEYSVKGIQIANNSDNFDANNINPENEFDVAWCNCWNNLGLCYMNRYGVDPDGAEVFNSFETAAKMGLPVAINNLAYCYENGIGVDEDCYTACELYKAAFEAGFEDAKEEYERLASLGYADSQNANAGSGNYGHQQMNWDDTDDDPIRDNYNYNNKPNQSINNHFDW